MNVNESTYILILAYFLCKVKDLSSKLPCGVNTTIVLLRQFWFSSFVFD